MKTKTLLLTISILLFTNILFSQNWFMEDVKWYHTPLGQFYGYKKMEFQSDTILNGSHATVLKTTVFKHNSVTDDFDIIPTQSLIFYDSAGLVFLWNTDLSEFDTLINMNAVPGDQWFTKTDYDSDSSESMSTTVIDTGYITINMENLKWLYVRYEFELFELPYVEFDTIVDQIGPLNLYILPWEINYLSGGNAGLKCYESNSIGVYSRQGQGLDCESIVTSTDEVIAPQTKAIRAFPNPVRDILTIQIEDLQTYDNIEVHIIEVNGKLVLNNSLSSSNELNLKNLKPGLFILQVMQDQKVIITQRIIKME